MLLVLQTAPAVGLAPMPAARAREPAVFRVRGVPVPQCALRAVPVVPSSLRCRRAGRGRRDSAPAAELADAAQRRAEGTTRADREARRARGNAEANVITRLPK